MKEHTIRLSAATLIMSGMLLALLTGCSTTHIQSGRTAAGATATPLSKVMVVGMDDRSAFRDPFENDAVEFLRKHQVEATASHTRFPLSELKGDKQVVRQRLLAAGAESLLVVRVTDVSDFAQGPPVTPGSMDLGAADEASYIAFTAPGGEINTVFRLGARLYRVQDGVVLWSGVVQTLMKEDSDQLAILQKVARTIVDRMAKDQVLP